MSAVAERPWRAAAGRPPLVLEATAIGKRFGSTVALADVTLRIPAGSIVGLVGPNGSGKTTALRMVAGLVRPDLGVVGVCGARAGTIEARQRLALVPDEPSGFDELTVVEYVSLLGRLYRVPAGHGPGPTALLDAFDLELLRDERLGALSRGRRRQVSFVAALALGTPLLVIDEATATLDPEAVVVTRSALRAHARRGGSVLLATQDLGFAESVCDSVTMLREGRVVTSGTPADVVRRFGARDLEEAFLVATGRPDLERDVFARLAAV